MLSGSRKSDVDAQTLVADGLVTISEATKLLSVSRSFLYLAMERGELAYCRFGRARRIPRRALLEFAAARLNGHFGPTETKGAGAGR